MRRVRERDVLYVMEALEQVITFDDPPTLILRVNNQHRQCVRCMGKTNGKEWMVDIYGKHFFYIHIPPAAATTADTLFSLILKLKAALL